MTCVFLAPWIKEKWSELNDVIFQIIDHIKNLSVPLWIGRVPQLFLIEVYLAEKDVDSLIFVCTDLKVDNLIFVQQLP